LQTEIGSVQDLNKQAFLQAIADRIVSSGGAPADWGSTAATPTSLGLAGDSLVPFDLDVDKVSRLSSDHANCVSYLEVLQAAKLSDIALGMSLSQMVSVNVSISGSTDVGASIEYAFDVQVNQNSRALFAGLQGYIVADGFWGNFSGSTLQSGLGYVTVEVPKSISGPALVVVFARASFDDRLTGFGVCQFVHQGGEVAPNHTYLGLSPISNSLDVESKFSGASAKYVYALSYGYSWNITSTFSGVYAIPECVDVSPLVLVAEGAAGEVGFVEWVSYPAVPLEAGADLSRSEANVFAYTVTINSVFYRLTVRFGDVPG